jgi:hypothetical protein
LFPLCTVPPEGRVAVQSTPASPPSVDEPDEADAAEVLEEREPVDPVAVVWELLDERDELAAPVLALLVMLEREPGFEVAPDWSTDVLLEAAVTDDDAALPTGVPVLSGDVPHATAAKSAGANT